jgi:hypothetical protein
MSGLWVGCGEAMGKSWGRLWEIAREVTLRREPDFHSNEAHKLTIQR